MKKLLVILTVAVFMTYCNDSETTEETPTTDSTTVSPSDTSAVPVDTPTRPADTVIKK